MHALFPTCIPTFRLLVCIALLYHAQRGAAQPGRAQPTVSTGDAAQRSVSTGGAAQRNAAQPVADSVVNVHDRGVYGDGATDQHQAIQKILDSHSRVFFPAGRYLISKSLALHSGQQLSGSDSTVFALHPTAGAPPDFAFLKISSQRNLRLTHLTFYAEDHPDRMIFAIDARNVHELTLDGITALNAGVARVAQRENAPYATIPDTLSSERFRQVGNSHVTITNCRGTGSQRSMAQQVAGVLIAYTDEWEITNSSFTRYGHGIQWWGGDSNPQRDGKLANVRKCRNGLVSQVEVTHVRGGGIWGSMGEHITVENCQVTHCGDVGIDFEGCFRSKAVNNYVAESNNGNIAVFHHNQDIVFANNQLVQSDPKRPHACIYNASQSQDNGQVTFDNNVFIATQGVGYIKQQGPSNRIIFTHNSLHNVVANFSFNNNHYVLIKENIFHITRPLAGYDYVIKAGQTHFGGEVVVERNQILASGTQGEAVYAISLYQSDYNASPTNRIIGNHIMGLPYQVKTEWAGGNAGCIATTYIESEQSLSPAAVRKVDTGARPAKLYVNDKEW